MNTHLRSLHAYVINLNRSADRLRRFNQECGSLFKSVTRIPAVDGRDIPVNKVADFAAEMNATVERVAATSGERNIWMKYPNRATNDGLRTTFKPDQVLKSARARNHVGAIMGIWSSHIRAIHEGLCEGHEQFIILEDDASPRTLPVDLAPDENDEIILWGSTTMGSFKADNLKSPSYRFVKPTSRYACLLATATEYKSVAVATDMWLTLSSTPGQLDLIWWEVLHRRLCVKLIPMGFTQVGTSTYKNAHKKV